MERSIMQQFVALSIHPMNGRLIINRSNFRYGLAGALLMDYLIRSEISLKNKKIETSFRRNGEIIHDRFADIIEKPSKPKRVLFWLQRISRNSRLLFRETINSLVSEGIIRDERRYFLNFIPYNRYFFLDIRSRKEIVEGLRNVLLHGYSHTSSQLMLIGLIKASGSSKLLTATKNERWQLRKLCREFIKKDELSSETDNAIRQLQTAIIAAVAVSVAAAHGSY